METFIKDHNEIAKRLNEFMRLDIPEAELKTAPGIKKIVMAMKAREYTNAHLNGMKIDLSSFENLCRRAGCYEVLFSNSLIPAIKNYLNFRFGQASLA